MPVIMTTDGRYHGHTPDKAAAMLRVANLTKENGPAVKLIAEGDWEKMPAGFEARAEAVKTCGEVIS